ncbi:unnamed protein product, partial [Mesorhabditis belari]|uniref:RNA helicase n=1 Tax=Mesorhabditis belari TaxID=2138241 RepID=A0AAF3FD75_9BILA
MAQGEFAVWLPPVKNKDSGREVNEKGLAFFRLFFYEILDEFKKTKQWSIFNNFKTFFGKNRMQKINQNLTCGDKAREYLTAYYALHELFGTNEGTLMVDQVVKELAPNLYTHAHGLAVNNNPVCNTFVKFFMRDDDPFFLDKVAASLHLYGFLDKIEPKHHSYRAFLDEFNDNRTNIRNRLREDVLLDCQAKGMDPRSYSREFDHRYFARVFLRNLPRCHQQALDGEDWIYDFIDEVKGCPRNRAMLTVFMPDYQQQLEVRAQQRMLAEQKDHGDIMEEDSEEVTTCRSQKVSGSEMFKKWSREREMSGFVPGDPPTLRAYQHELAESAVQGKNVVVVAPTGSGKTFVAAHIARQHLDQAERDGRPARVVFIVPKVPLVDQQQRAFDHFFGGRYLVAGMHGNAAIGEDDNRKELVLGAHLTVMTPQLLINMLKSIRRADRIYLCDLTLIMLDECHHTTKESAYNILMDLLQDYGEKMEPRNAPQVVGLTASLGTGGGHTTALNTDAVCEYIYKLCASMNAHRLCTVQKHKEELNRYVQLPDDEVKRCRRSDRDGVNFSTQLLTTMQEVEVSKVAPELKKLTTGSNPIFTEREINLGSSLRCPTRYESIVSQMMDKINKQHNLGQHLKITLTNGLRFLKVCVGALLIDEVMPSVYALAYLEETFKNIQRNEFLNELFGHMKRTLHERSQNEDLSKKEIVQELKKRLEDQLTANPDSRVLIFVKERSTAQRLYQCINTHRFFESLTGGGRYKIAGFVTSAQSKGKKASNQTQTEQKQMLEDFNNGVIKIMVSTSVVEEGLDVQTCNLIIKYNMTGSTISEMQKRGRARAAGSKSVLLVVSDSVEQREMENRHGEMLIERAIRVINCLSEDEFTQRCELHRGNRMRDRKQAAIEEARLQQNIKTCTIQCLTCENVIGQSTMMRTILNHNYVLCNTDIWKKVVLIPQKKIKSVGEMTLVLGSANCNNMADIDDPKSRCPNSLGTVIRYAGVYLVQLAINQILLIDQEGNTIEEKKKWSAVKKSAFYIKEITNADLKNMTKCLPEKIHKEFLGAEAGIKEAAAQQMKRKQTRREKEDQPLQDWEPVDYDEDLDDEGTAARADEGGDEWKDS